MKIYDAIYIGKGFIKALKPVKEGENIEIFVPHELFMDYNQYRDRLVIKETPGGFNN